MLRLHIGSIAVVGCVLTTAACAADAPPTDSQAPSGIFWEWSLKAGGELDADGQPTVDNEGPRPRWGLAMRWSCQFHWSTGTAGTPELKPATPTNGLSTEEQQLVDLANAERKKVNVPPLSADPVLMKLAREQSAHMARLQQISHELEGRTFSLRMQEVKYRARAAGEICAEGAETPAEAIGDWLTSEGHKGTMLSDKYTRVGAALSSSADGRRYFTLVFANPLE